MSGIATRQDGIDGSLVLSNVGNSGINRRPFNPVKELKETEQLRVWTTESVELAMDGLSRGATLLESPFNTRIKDFDLRASLLPFELSDEEMLVFKKLRKDIVLFGNTVVELKDGDSGWTKIRLRDYQETLLNDYENHNRHILMFPRQSGKTTTTIVAILHFLIFNKDKDIVVVAQSQTVVEEVMGKIKSAYSKLPFFLQSGVIRWTKDSLQLDNGCRMKIGVASESVVQGFSLDFLFVDEFAYIKNPVAVKFWDNVYPALRNNPNSKVIIASTPNGRNLFYEMWMKAINKESNFKPSRIFWYDVPRYRKDGTKQPLEEFKAEVIADSSLEGWLMGYECSFDTQLSSIFSTQMQVRLREQQSSNDTDWLMDNDPIGAKYNMRFVDKKLINYDIKTDWFVWGVDIAEGLGQDSSVIKIRKIVYEGGEFRYKLVGIFQDNEIAVDDFAKLLMDLSAEFDSNKIHIAVENNNYGGEFFNQMSNLSQYDADYTDFDFDVIAKFRRDSKDDYEYGYRTDAKRKRTSVSFYKRNVSTEIFDDSDTKSVEQALNFGRNKNGTYSAQYGHDDLVAGDLAIAYLLNANDLFNTDFLEQAQLQIKIDLNILEDERVLQYLTEKEKERRKHIQVLDLPKNTVIRNSTERVLNRKLDAINRRKEKMEDREFYSKRRGNVNNVSGRNRLKGF